MKYIDTNIASPSKFSVGPVGQENYHAQVTITVELGQPAFCFC